MLLPPHSSVKKLKVVEKSDISHDSLSFKIRLRKSPFSLYPLIFTGGADLKPGTTRPLSNEATVDKTRISLVIALYDEIRSRQVMGASDKTISRYLYETRKFFLWADKEDLALNKANLKQVYIQYANSLVNRQRTVGDLKEASIFAMTSTLSSIFDAILGLQNGLLRLTQIRKPTTQPSYVKEKHASLDKEWMRMGRALLSISKGVSTEVLVSSHLVEIELEPGCTLPLMQSKITPACEADGSTTMEQIRLLRRGAINIRTEAELLIFISQTGMNLEQALNLKIQEFYIPTRSRDSSGTIPVKAYKARKQGEVLFEIFPAYREHFTRYLDFRKSVIDDAPDGPLFMYIPSPKHPNSLPRRELVLIKKVFAKYGIPYRTTRQLRGLRLNFIKEYTGDPEIAAGMGSHSLATFNSAYTKVDVDKALREVAMFHKKNDPAIAPPGPGLCTNRAPAPVEGSPAAAPSPDCGNPAGCLFCVNQRDLKTFDHIWSLASYRHLKKIELSKDRSKYVSANPAHIVIQRISDKLTAICDSADMSSHLKEAIDRVTEGDSHHNWAALIELAESTL